MSGANYNGRQPDNSSYIKTFVPGSLTNLWTIVQFVINQTTIAFVSPIENLPNVYVPGDLYVKGKIINADPSTSNNYSTQVTHRTMDSNNQNVSQETLNRLLNLIDNMQKQIDELKAVLI